MERLLLVGLDQPEYEALKARVDIAIVWHPELPRIRLEAGRLLAERRGRAEHFLEVDRVIFHGIFADDFPFLTALALWRGRCLPGARGLMDGRLRLPCLARSVAASRFGGMPRGWVAAGESIVVEGDAVAKWGNWHCGENKERFTGRFDARETTVVEPFIRGEAVRIMLLGERAWQIRLAGDGWLKSIHHPAAGFMPIDLELLADTRALGADLGLEMLGVDYMVAEDGTRHLLEVNHVPNVTVFPEIREAFLDYATAWVRG